MTDPRRRGQDGCGDRPDAHRQLRGVQRRGWRGEPGRRGAGRQRLRGAQSRACGRRGRGDVSCTTAPTSSSTATAANPTMRNCGQRHAARMPRRSCSANGSRSMPRGPTCCVWRACLDRRRTGPVGAGRSITSSMVCEQGREVRVFTDRIVSPSYSPDIAAATRHLVMSGAPPGSITASTTATRPGSEVAREAARVSIGVDAALVRDHRRSGAAEARRGRAICALSTEEAGGGRVSRCRRGRTRCADGSTRLADGTARTARTKNRTKDHDMSQARSHHRDHRSGRLVSRGAAARTRVTKSPASSGDRARRTVADRAPARSHHAASRRPARPAVADAHRPGREAARVLQPGGDVVRAGVMGSAAAHRRLQLDGRDAAARSGAPGRYRRSGSIRPRPARCTGGSGKCRRPS